MKNSLFNFNHSREANSPGKKLLFLFSILLIVGACVDKFEENYEIYLSQSGYTYGVKDAAHGGEEALYFLPPLVKQPNYSGVFNATLSPVVEISEDFSFSRIHATFTTAGSGAQNIRIDQKDEHYIVNWQPSSTKAVAGRIYRIRVKVGDKILGHADVGLIRNGKDLVPPGVISRNVNATLPIKFRIEGDHGSEATPVRIALNPEEVDILKNEEYQYTVNLFDQNDQKIEGGEVVWTVSDESLATIDANGLVRALDYGYVKVTATLGSLTASSHLFVVDVKGTRPGSDAVVLEVFTIENSALSRPDNQILFKNLINFYNLKSRGSGNKIWLDCGRNRFEGNPLCYDSSWDQFKSIIGEEGYDLESSMWNLNDDSSIEIPAEVKVIIFFLPTSLHYTLNDINSLKKFAEEGGRIIVYKSSPLVYFQGGFRGGPIVNQLLLNLGTNIMMKELSNEVNIVCPYNTITSTSISPHSINRGVSTLSGAGCSSVLEIGGNALPLWYTRNNTHILAAWAPVDTVPITTLQEVSSEYP